MTGLAFSITEIGKRRGCLLSYSQAEPGRELTQPSPHILAEPCTVISFTLISFTRKSLESKVHKHQHSWKVKPEGPDMVQQFVARCPEDNKSEVMKSIVLHLCTLLSIVLSHFGHQRLSTYNIAYQHFHCRVHYSTTVGIREFKNLHCLKI